MTNRYLITGAEQGLGARIVEELHATESCAVENMPGDVIRTGADAIFAWLHHHPGPYTHVINNYGINHLSWIGKTPVADAEILKVNVMGPYWVVNDLKYLRNPPARVLNIASQTYRVPQRCTALYAASKAALVQMSRVMARELAPEGWIINVLAPGKIRDTTMSEMTDRQVMELRGWSREEMEDYALGLIPMGRFTTTREVAEAALAVLALPDYVNGTVIDMTGAA